MTDLIKRLQEATDFNQEIVVGAAILYAQRNGWIDSRTAKRAMAWVNAGAFVDAALMLVPEGAWWSIGTIEPGKCLGTVGLEKPAGELFANSDSVSPEEIVHWTYKGTSSEPALAFCIAALKAREGKTDD